MINTKQTPKNNFKRSSLIMVNKTYREMLDIIDDQYLLAIAEERMKNDNGVTYSFEEILSKDGLTLADIEAMEDVEIE